MIKMLSGKYTVDNNDNIYMQILIFVKACLCSISQVVLLNNAIAGLVIAAAICYHSLLLGIMAALGAIISVALARLMKFDADEINSGLFGYNGVLVGLAVGYFMGSANFLFVAILAATLAATSVLLSFSLNRVLSVWSIPPYTLSFNIITLLFFSSAVYFGYFPGVHVPDSIAGISLISDFGQGFMRLEHELLVNSVLRSLSQLFFVNNIVSSILILVALIIGAPKVAIFAFIGSLAGSLFGMYMEADQSSLYNGLIGYNAYISAVAIGLIFEKVSIKSLLWSIFAAIFATVVHGSFNSILAIFDLPVLTLPFCLVAIMLYPAVKYVKK